MLTIDDHDAIRAAVAVRYIRENEIGKRWFALMDDERFAGEDSRHVIGYLRYEALRKLNAAQYARLSALHLAIAMEGEPRVTFDELVDLLVIGELTV